jgi:hypothetical protein
MLFEFLKINSQLLEIDLQMLPPHFYKASF